MSSEEKQRRELYKRKRNKWIAIQSVIIGVVLLLVSIFVLSYKHYNQDYLINYNEYGKLDYKVYIHKVYKVCCNKIVRNRCRYSCFVDMF